MKTKIRKWFWDPEEEEKWLNEMATEGLAMCDYEIFRYTFDDCTPGEYIYRIELMKDSPKTPEGARYIRFMEDSGVECMHFFGRWAYFRKKATDGAFEIYSDFDSKIKHYKRISNRWLIVGIFDFIVAIILWKPPSSLTLVVLGMVLLSMWWRYAKKVKRLKAERAILE